MEIFWHLDIRISGKIIFRENRVLTSDIDHNSGVFFHTTHLALSYSTQWNNEVLNVLLLFVIISYLNCSEWFLKEYSSKYISKFILPEKKRPSGWTVWFLTFFYLDSLQLNNNPQRGHIFLFCFWGRDNKLFLEL